ncbi:hypothetical protein E4U56_003416 [Claviceps arundinis]|uniref:Uncharacterized protein n=1 Tax=Claviceps arundinis TaxID=1623583 RepID=A0A9P7MN07_9HYPO|nr:hypothetical protein E4U56_003416 [Claviceps arundinis]
MTITKSLYRPATGCFGSVFVTEQPGRQFLYMNANCLGMMAADHSSPESKRRCKCDYRHVVAQDSNGSTYEVDDASSVDV